MIAQSLFKKRLIILMIFGVTALTVSRFDHNANASTTTTGSDGTVYLPLVMTTIGYLPVDSIQAPPIGTHYGEWVTKGNPTTKGIIVIYGTNVELPFCERGVHDYSCIGFDPNTSNGGPDQTLLFWNTDPNNAPTWDILCVLYPVPDASDLLNYSCWFDKPYQTIVVSWLPDENGTSFWVDTFCAETEDGKACYGYNANREPVTFFNDTWLPGGGFDIEPIFRSELSQSLVDPSTGLPYFPCGFIGPIPDYSVSGMHTPGGALIFKFIKLPFEQAPYTSDRGTNDKTYHLYDTEFGLVAHNGVPAGFTQCK